MTETAPQNVTTGPASAPTSNRKLGSQGIQRVLTELEGTVDRVLRLAGTGQDFERAGEELKGYGADAALVDLAVELADARDRAEARLS